MNELTQALRDFADSIDRGEAELDPTQCVIVLADDAGMLNATYIGRNKPAHRAGIQLAAAGILKFNEAQLRSEVIAALNPGSTH